MSGYSDPNEIFPNDGNVLLTGTAGQDILYSGRGDDALQGRGGDDTFDLSAGFGHDTILADPSATRDYSSFDQVRFGVGLNADAMQVSRIGSDLVLRFETGESLTISEHFNVTGRQIDRFVFGDKEVLYPWQIELRVRDFLGSPGADFFSGNDLDNRISGLGGNDRLSGGGGNDTLIGGEGSDSLTGGVGDDTYLIALGQGDDSIFGPSTTALDNQSTGFDQLVLGAGITPESIGVSRIGSTVTLSYSLGEGDEAQSHSIRLYNQYGGDGSLLDDPNIDRIVFDDGTIWYPWKILQRNNMPSNGNDYLSLDDGGGVLDGLAGDDTLVGGVGIDILIGSTGNDLLNSGDANDRLEGGNGTDTLSGGNGADRLLGGSGADWLFGGDGNDVIVGGLGDDSLYGGNGSDSYEFEAGFGADTIFDFSGLNRTEGDFNQIVFGAGLAPEDAVLSNEDANLVIRFGEDRLTVFYHFFSFSGEDYYQIGRLKFEDGTIWYPWDIEMRADLVQSLQMGTEGDDTLSATLGGSELTGLAGSDLLQGGNGDDVLNGGAGRDTMRGGLGDDVYIFNLGDGTDLIQNGGNTGYDEIRFGAGIDPRDIRVSREGNDMFLDNIRNDDAIGIDEAFATGRSDIDRIVFEDGTIWYASRIEARAMIGNEQSNTLYGNAEDNNIQGRGGADWIWGYEGNDTLHGGAGDDWVYGGAGDDRLSGGAGDDRIQADEGNDTLFGGRDDDSLLGSGGDDVYIFDADFGQDQITNSQQHFSEDEADSGDFDRIEFTDAYAAEDVSVSRSQNSLILRATDGGSILVFNHFGADRFAIDQVSFADGTLWDRDEIAAQSRVPNAFGNTLFGTEAGDTLGGLAGADVLFGGAGNDQLSGDADNDELYGQEGADTLAGGAGDDRLSGGRGDDTYLFDLGSGRDTIHNGEESEPAIEDFDRVLFGAGIAPEDLTVTRDAALGLTLSHANGVDALSAIHFFATVDANPADVEPDMVHGYSIDEFIFDDGTVWTTQDLRAVVNQTGEGDDIYYGGFGNDVVQGFGGNDQFYTGRGDDWITPGAGNNTVDGGRGVDMVSFVDGSASVVVDLNRSTAQIDGFTNSLISIENATGTRFGDVLTGDDQDNRLRGMAGEDLLAGGAGGDHLIGGGRNDTLDGGAGTDYAYFSGRQDAYTIRTQGDVTFVQQIAAGGDGMDRLINVEVLIFSDSDVIL